jgi:hypothetical protein
MTGRRLVAALAAALGVVALGPTISRSSRLLVAWGEDGVPAAPPPAQAPIVPRAKPQPCDVLIVISGREQGLMIPCGCTYPQRGGLPRRAALLEEWRAVAKASAVISVGDTLGPGIPAQNDQKADLFRAALESMGYAAQLLSADDLSLSPLASALSTPRGVGLLTPRPPLNVKLSDHGCLAASARVQPMIRWTVGELPARAVSLVDFSLEKALVESAGGVADAVVAPGEALKALKKEPGLLVIAANVMREDLGPILSEASDKADLVIIVDVAGEIASRAGAKNRSMTRPLVVTFDEQGKEVAVVALTKGESGPATDKGKSEKNVWTASWSVVPLDPPYDEGESKARESVERLFAVYRAGVRDAGLLEKFEGVADAGPSYVGEKACASCHQAIRESWAKTSHAHAFAALETETADSFGDPECVGCHTVGWSRDSRRHWLRTSSGFHTKVSTPDRINVQCESCHGPGSAHVADTKQRLAMASKGDPGVRAVCAACHDVENSNGFNATGGFSKYLPEVDHSDVPSGQRTNKPR